MTRTLIVLAAFLALSVPAALAAPPEGKGKPESPGQSAAAPGQSADKNAAKKCKAERAANPEAFKTTYGTNANKANAFGKCVSSKVKKAEEQAEAQEARENAAKKCKAERAANPEAFKTTYGTNANKANAFGKCVSGKVKKEKETTG
jgi:hypothetical protein